jgi:hypothetical protein
MKDIIELNKRIMTEAPAAVPKDLGFIMVTRENAAGDELAALPDSIRTDLEALRQKLNEGMPDDFGYQIFLGNADPDLMIIYNDGAQTVVNCPMAWNKSQSVFEQLSGINWADQRRAALANGQIFDQMIEEAKHKPAALPSTKELQDVFAEPIRKFIKAKSKDASKVHVLAWHGDQLSNGDLAVLSAELPDMKVFCKALPDMMAAQQLIIAVLADGKPLSEKKIEKLKQQALKELQGMPISLAKALLKM